MKKLFLVVLLSVLVAAAPADASWFSKIFPSWGSHGKRNSHNSGESGGSSTPTPVPEPGTLILLSTGIVGLVAYKIKKKKDDKKD